MRGISWLLGFAWIAIAAHGAMDAPFKAAGELIGSRPAAAAAETFELVQTCPAPDPGELYCGSYAEECNYCASDLPYYCPNSGTCYGSITEAMEGCGNGYVVCGVPVN